MTGSATESVGVDIVTTTISGSLQDQRKVGRIGETFELLTDRPVRVHVADSHEEAARTTRDIVAAGGRTLVSAGGAGTFNAVLGGASRGGVVPSGLKLGYLRKGSADLIGKALGMPDDLAEGAAALVSGLDSGLTIPADVLTVSAEQEDGSRQEKPLLGFGGVGVFGEVPVFTESRLVKLYKGVLGSLFGDYGPFYVGLALALGRWNVLRSMGRVEQMTLQLDDERTGPALWATVIFVNGDLGKAFPLGQGLSIGSGTFRVVALRYEGIGKSLGQVRSARSGALLDDPRRHDAYVAEGSRLTIRPVSRGPYMVNVDGVRLPSWGDVEMKVGGRIQLIPGRGPHAVPLRGFAVERSSGPPDQGPDRARFTYGSITVGRPLPGVCYPWLDPTRSHRCATRMTIARGPLSSRLSSPPGYWRLPSRPTIRMPAHSPGAHGGCPRLVLQATTSRLSSIRWGSQRRPWVVST